MNREALQEELLAAPDHDHWVEAIAACFDEHGVWFGHGTDNARDEAFWLVRHLQGWDDAAWDRAPDTGLVPPVVDIAQRRVDERKPLAYLINEAWFCGLRFFVDERVLVPRSPLAELIEAQFSPWCRLEPGDRVLDVGTGSGCIAIAIAVACPGVRVDATDQSAPALEVARRNVELHEVDARVNTIEADLFAPAGGPYRVIISNPPYVPAGEIGNLPAEYRWEPEGGLAGGDSGLDPVIALLRLAPQYLQPEGVLVVEVGLSEQALMQRYPDLPAVWLDFERGGDGVFLIGERELREFTREHGL